MKIVALSDTHGKYREVEVPDGDVLIFAGDMLKHGSRKEIPDFSNWLIDLPHAVKIIIAGNHDWAFQKTSDEARFLLYGGTSNNNGANIFYLQDCRFAIDKVKFYGSPWQPEFFDWAFNLPRGQALKEKWDLIPDDTDVLITHGPPHGILDSNQYDKRFGCIELLRRVTTIKPKIHIFGHAHGNYGYVLGRSTCYYNVAVCDESYQIVRPPTEIYI